MDIILFGMQGSGKGTQAKLLADQYDLNVFEMGGALREMIVSGTELGNRIKATVEAGELVSDEIIMQVVEAFLSSQPPEKRLLFDGIPRTLGQSEALLTLLKHHGRDATGIIIHISETEATERLTKRRVCQNCKMVHPGFYEGDRCKECGGPLMVRSDDSNTDAIKMRLESFKKETLPVVESFKQAGKLIEIDGMQEVEKVTAHVMEKASHLLA